MNCPIVYSEEICQTPCELNDCTDEHLTTFCPPPCAKCSQACCTPCESNSSCLINPCATSSRCLSICDSNAICCKPTSKCHNRYEILKHVARCPPKPSCSSRCVQRSRTSYKPVEKCRVAGDLPCYETIYMRAFNTPEACCPETFTVCDTSSCCSLGC